MGVYLGVILLDKGDVDAVLQVEGGEQVRYGPCSVWSCEVIDAWHDRTERPCDDGVVEEPPALVVVEGGVRKPKCFLQAEVRKADPLSQGVLYEVVFNCVSFLVYLQSGCHALRACARRTDGGVLNTPQCTPQWLP